MAQGLQRFASQLPNDPKLGCFEVRARTKDNGTDSALGRRGIIQPPLRKLVPNVWSAFFESLDRPADGHLSSQRQSHGRSPAQVLDSIFLLPACSPSCREQPKEFSDRGWHIQRDKYVLSSEYGYAVPHNLRVPAELGDKFVQAEKDLIQLLQALVNPSQRRTVALLVHLSRNELDTLSRGLSVELGQFFEDLAENRIPKLTMTPYRPYLRNIGNVSVQAGCFKSRQMVLRDGSPLMPVKARWEFTDLIEGEVQIGYHTHLYASTPFHFVS